VIEKRPHEIVVNITGYPLWHYWKFKEHTSDPSHAGRFIAHSVWIEKILSALESQLQIDH
jgi:hypothetical protein